MIPFRPRLIAIDLDGTLLSYGRLIEGTAKQGVERLRALGVEVTIVTGRMHASARHFAERLGIESPLVALNGTICMAHPEPILHRNVLDEAFARWIVARVPDELETYLLDDDHIHHLPHVTRRESLDFFGGGGNYRGTHDLDPVLIGGVEQVHLLGEKSILDGFLDQLRAAELTGWDTFGYPAIEHDWWHAEIRPAGDTKGVGLKRLCDYYAVEPEHTVAFGDWLNDLPMFEVAGYSIAVGNAEEKVKFAADEVLLETNLDDGVGKYLNRLADWLVESEAPSIQDPPATG